MRRGVAVLVAVLMAAACAPSKTSRSRVTTPSPGSCTPLDLAVAPETAPIVSTLAQRFNRSGAATLGAGSCAFVHVWSVDSATAERQLASSWPASGVDGPQPAAWIPASSAWAALLGARAVVGASLAQTNVVVAMPTPLATASHVPLAWTDLATSARHRSFRLGKANPTLSTDALLATIAVDKDRATAAALERSVVYYGASTNAFFDNVQSLSAIITNQRAVGAYNAGAPRTPLVVVSRAGAAPPLDNPFVYVGPSSSRAAAAAFEQYLRAPDAQTAFAAAGYAPGAEHATPPADVAGALSRWSMMRKPARVMILFDVSDSMGDSISRDITASKLTYARAALTAALGKLGPNDEVGLRIFSTDLHAPAGANWLDVVPMRRLATNGAALRNAIPRLAPQRGSPLYAATAGAFDAVAKSYDPSRINGVVLLTDGFNEDEHVANRATLLAHLGRAPQVHVFTIALGTGADVKTLRAFSAATNAAFYSASNPVNIGTAFSNALANF